MWYPVMVLIVFYPLYVNSFKAFIRKYNLTVTFLFNGN